MPMESSRTVVQGLTARLVVSRVYSLPLRMRLRYEPADPYVVRATFFSHSDEPVEWILGRDLLADGLEGCAGHGDVRIWSAVGRGDQAMYIALGSRAGAAARGSRAGRQELPGKHGGSGATGCRGRTHRLGHRTGVPALPKLTADHPCPDRKGMSVHVPVPASRLHPVRPGSPRRL
ncbi:SsgA family sporulation/cell division regulator [Streptomyces echinatus]|uniref:SsgA family sporulation/cell division regulator n=1 Tax=Streptomyces echinatus TaxID=67293 RepID=UPI003CD0BEBE